MAVRPDDESQTSQVSLSTLMMITLTMLTLTTLTMSTLTTLKMSTLTMVSCQGCSQAYAHLQEDITPRHQTP
jgi:hypothetical protein